MTTFLRLVTLLVAALVAAGCSSDAGDPTVTPPSETAAAPAPTDESSETEPDGTQAEGLEGVKTYRDLSQDHVPGPVSYPQTPPVGGEHADQWLNCGLYREPVASENAVHSMEHGAVWITYGADVDPESLRSFAEQEYVLISPFEGLPSPVVASAWGVQLTLDGPDDPRLPLFVETFAAGPQTPEPGAPCDGGLGEPEGGAASV